WMSKLPYTLFSFFLSLFLFSGSVICLFGQSIEADIQVNPGSVVNVRGRFEQTGGIKDPRLVSFEKAALGAEGLDKRIRNLELADASGKSIAFRKLVDGEYLAAAAVVGWRYEVDLSPLRNRAAAAHASWLMGDRGILMGSDLLPLSARSGVLRVAAPQGWRVFGPSGTIADIGKVVIPVGTGWTEIAPTAESPGLLITGSWHFTAPEAADMIREIHEAYRKIYQEGAGLSTIVISNFPAEVSAGNWEAETRGNTVTIISSDMPFRSQSLQRLHEQLRHEMFHLWIPNRLNLIGSYDWFYEGFALYESLKLAVRLNRIRFDDFLDTLSRAHTIDGVGGKRVSLIQASANRFVGSNTQLYARGMLVAFLCDLALLEQSKGKRSVEDLLRELFVKHRKPAEATDANTAVLELLRANPNLVPIVEKYIAGTENLEWTSELAGAGIEDADAGPLTNLRVKEKLNGRPKALLDKLGYNNWRKLSLKSK
ncbi:MAG: hypothetical protein ABIO91_05195, partial [Pyrinomonadaceae bacterium]